MSFEAILGDIIPRYMRLTKTEAKVLDTIVTEKRGNIYSLWKVSRLKHYPTVLRAVKKLGEKGLVQVSNERGTRDEKIYVPTLVGTLVFYVLNGQEKKIVDIVKKNSSLFRYLFKIDKDKYWAFRAVHEIITHEFAESRSIDEAIKFHLGWALSDAVLNIHEEGRSEWIAKVSKVKWIKELAIREIKDERSDLKRRIKELEKLERKLVNMDSHEQYFEEKT